MSQSIPLMAYLLCMLLAVTSVGCQTYQKLAPLNEMPQHLRLQSTFGTGLPLMNSLYRSPFGGGDQVEGEAALQRRRPGLAQALFVEQADVEQVDGDRVEHLAGGQQPVGGGLQVRAVGVRLRAGKGLHGLLNLLVEVGGGEQVLV